MAGWIFTNTHEPPRPPTPSDPGRRPAILGAENSRTSQVREFWAVLGPPLSPFGAAFGRVDIHEHPRTPTASHTRAQGGTTEYHRIPQPTTEHNNTTAGHIPQEAQGYHKKHKNTTRSTTTPQEAQVCHKKRRNTTRSTRRPHGLPHPATLAGGRRSWAPGTQVRATYLSFGPFWGPL